MSFYIDFVLLGEEKMDEIAEQLDYSNAASAKTQKNKCMNKLTSYIKTLLS